MINGRSPSIPRLNGQLDIVETLIAGGGAHETSISQGLRGCCASKRAKLAFDVRIACARDLLDNIYAVTEGESAWDAIEDRFLTLDEMIGAAL